MTRIYTVSEFTDTARESSGMEETTRVMVPPRRPDRPERSCRMNNDLPVILPRRNRWRSNGNKPTEWSNGNKPTEWSNADSSHVPTI